MSAYPIASPIIGESAAIRRLRALIEKVASSDLPVLIQGPTGSGKELVARALHQHSGRTGAFVAFNVCAVGDALFEDALFGHVKGAFTGAVRDTMGYLAEANGGTLFLDEICGLPIAAQGKLLRAVETRTFRAVGASRDRTSDFRLVAATNLDLRTLTADGRFREDLIFRLRGACLSVPPLRERLDDIPGLVRHFTSTLRHRTRQPIVVTASGLAALQQHDWPGNVRELKHLLECAAALADTPVLDCVELTAALGSTLAGDETMLALRQHGPALSGWDQERRQLLKALHIAGWKTDQVAMALRVSRATVYRRMEELAITPPRRQRSGDTGTRALPVSAPYVSAAPVDAHLDIHR